MYGESVVKVHYFPFSACTRKTRAAECAIIIDKAALCLLLQASARWASRERRSFSNASQPYPKRGSEGSRHLDILLNLLIKSFRMQKCGKVSPEKAG